MSLDLELEEPVDRLTVARPALPPVVAGAPSYPSTVKLLPSAPTDEELGRYVHREVAVIVGLSAISIACLVVSQVRFARLEPWLLLALPFLAFTLAYYLISFVVTVRSRNFDMTSHELLIETWRPSTYPSVDVMLPICNEGLDVLANTWQHVAALAEAYSGSVMVHVLDDGASPAASLLALEFGFRYTVRPDRGHLKKAGNLRHGCLTSGGDYIAIFDADFCPRPDFLAQLLPYPESDPSIGIVQSPQYFRSSPRQTWMERGASAVQELFYRLIQVSSDARGGAICVGSCAIYRRTALAAIGGISQIEHSEDIHTGFDLSRAGWRLRYVPIPLATGLCPADSDSFLTQQYRWCAGSMSILCSRKFWTTRMPFTARMCYLSGFCYYVHTALFVFVTPVIPLVLIVFEPQHVLLGNFVWIVPSMVYAMVVFPLWNRITYGPTAVMAKYLYGWAHLFAILDAVRGKSRGWQTTGGLAAKADTARIWTAIIVWGALTSIAWVEGAALRASQLGLRNWSFIEVTGVLYAGVFGMAVLSHLDPNVGA